MKQSRLGLGCAEPFTDAEKKKKKCILAELRLLLILSISSWSFEP